MDHHFLCYSLMYPPQIFFSKVYFVYDNFDLLYVVPKHNYMLSVYTFGNVGRSLDVGSDVLHYDGSI